jgi:GAF domain-containing protein
MSQSDDQLRAVIAAGVLHDEATHRELLEAIVQVARAIFHARAASVLLLDETTSELVFEAVVGEGEDTLVGRRFPCGTGVAGWVLATGQPLILTDVTTDPRFSAEVAHSTGYVPQGIMAVPLIHGDDPIGVLEVLDRPANAQFSLDEVDLLGLFGMQAAAALALLRRARLAQAALRDGDPDLGALAGIASHVAARRGAPEAGGFLQALNALLGRLEQ